MRLRWTLQAADDLVAIREFIGRDSISYARQVIEGLYEAAGEITAFPDMGRVVPEWGQPDIREILRPPYRIVYRRRPEVIEILTVHHSARLFPGDLRTGAV